jgi:phosphatidylglycerophosphate synthase
MAGPQRRRACRALWALGPLGYNGRMAALRAQGANALTALRVLVTPLFVALLRAAAHSRSAGRLAAAAFVVAALSDVGDGRLARRWGTAGRAGRVFDHLADITFILAALSGYAVCGIAPWWVPAAIAASFAVYVVDSRARAAGRMQLIGSRIGHVAGVLNYTLVGVLTFNTSAGLAVLSVTELHALYCLVPLYSAAAIVTRLAGRPAADVGSVARLPL